MKKEMIILVTGFMILGLVFSLTAVGAIGGFGKNKVTVCHVPAGDLDKQHEIVVSSSAIKAHLAHGDSLGVCEEPEPPGCILGVTFPPCP